MTRGSVTGQVKCLSMIIAMENFIPDRRAVATQQKSAPAPTPQIYQSAWLRGQQATTTAPEPSSDPAQEEAQQEALARPQSPTSPIAFPSRTDGRLMSPSLLQTPESPSL